MKTICIARNYREHAKELNNPVPERPVFFMKPDSSILTNGKPFFYPDFSKEIHHEIELVIKINRLGKNISPEFAGRYYDEIGIGVDFTARDLQRECKTKGLPWEIAKAFDGSAVLGAFINKQEIKNHESIKFDLHVNHQLVQQGDTNDLIFSFEELISYISRFCTLKIGDLIFTGTPAGVGPVSIGDKLEGQIEGQKLLSFDIK